MLADAQFLSDFVAYDVMAFQLDILSDLFAAQSDGVQTQIIDFIILSPVLKHRKW